jgi:hypothetical protein
MRKADEAIDDLNRNITIYVIITERKSRQYLDSQDRLLMQHQNLGQLLHTAVFQDKGGHASTMPEGI